MPAPLPDNVPFNVDRARQQFWFFLRNLRSEIFEEMAKHLPEKDGKTIRYSVEMQKELRALVGRYSLAGQWCFYYALNQVTYWKNERVKNPDIITQLPPFAQPFTVKHNQNGASQAIIFPTLKTTEDSNLNQLYNLYELPNEMKFHLKDEWQIVRGETLAEAKARIEKKLIYALGSWYRGLKKTQTEWQIFRPVHFEWLIRHAVPKVPGEKTESYTKIATVNSDTATVCRDVKRLANFIDLPLKLRSGKTPQIPAS